MRNKSHKQTFLQDNVRSILCSPNHLIVWSTKYYYCFERFIILG